MSEQSLTVYEQAITSERTAEVLAAKHGFESVVALAKSLPQDARVLDVGAGASPFGKEVASLRPDISWTNFDYSYQDPAILEEVTTNAPTNIEHIAGDATKLDEVFGPETFDAVFSYWLLPHLSIDSPEPAQAAAKAMFNTTKEGGIISVGPQAGQKRVLSSKSTLAVKIVKDGSQTADSYADMIVAATKLTKTNRYIQKQANEVATPFFGTTRYAKREGHIPQLYHPESGEYVSSLSRKGIKTAGRLVIALAKHAYKQHKVRK